MMVEANVVGLRKFTSKKGNVVTMISVTYPMEKIENTIEVKGIMAETFFVPDYVAPKVSAGDVGKTIKLVTSFYNSKNNLVDIVS